MGYFWNKHQICDASTWRDHELLKDFLNDLNDVGAQICPFFLEKKRMVAIQALRPLMGGAPGGSGIFLLVGGSLLMPGFGLGMGYWDRMALRS